MRSDSIRIFMVVVSLAAMSQGAAGSDGAPGHVVPSFEDVLSLRGAGDAVISPDGGSVAFTVRTTDWKENRYDTEIWLVRKGDEPFQLTRTSGESSTSPAWSPDGDWIAFIADRGGKSQVYIIRADGGEAQAATSAGEGVTMFGWAPEGMRIAYVSPEKKSEEKEKTEKRYGMFSVEDAEYGASHLYVIDVEPDMEPSPAEVPCAAEKAGDSGKAGDAEGGQAGSEDKDDGCLTLPEAKCLTAGKKFDVTGFSWSPDGTRLAFVHQKDSNIISFSTADISVADLGTGMIDPLVESVGSDEDPVWSPDSEWIAFVSAHGDTISDYYANNHLLMVPAKGGQPVRLAGDYDGLISDPLWSGDWIYFTGWERTDRRIYRVSPSGGGVKTFSDVPGVVWTIDISGDGKTLCFVMQDASSLAEVYTTPVKRFRPEAMTSMTAQIEGWSLGTSEVISWESRDGTVIEGVLHKPDGFDPDRSYPLLVLIHGGPTWIDFPAPVMGYVYPVTQWLARGALVLRPNYRGSLGYGEEFRSLNVRNIGVGDSWDVLSGVDHLIGQGIAAPDSLGAMGWSQGGFISAFLTTRTDRFRAISVGAGISNWITYYVNTDVHPWTRQYLEATPWDDPEIYALASPITTVGSATTPTLIQHGEFDRRVPTPNGYELYQGLQDAGVETRLVIYKGFGHGIMKPRERLAGVTHNWHWFAKYLWGEDVEVP